MTNLRLPKMLRPLFKIYLRTQVFTEEKNVNGISTLLKASVQVSQAATILSQPVTLTVPLHALKPSANIDMGSFNYPIYLSLVNHLFIP